MKRLCMNLAVLLAMAVTWPLLAQNTQPSSAAAGQSPQGTSATSGQPAQKPQPAASMVAQSQANSIDVASYEKRVSVKTLPNGLTVVLWRRPEAPVFSFFTLVDAGSAQDPLYQTGLAHMMEHMAFKGTPDIGTKDYAAEKVALEKVEQTYAAYEAERIKRVGQDPQKLAQLKQAWQDAIKAADQYVIKNQFGEVVESAWRRGLNAFTNYDETAYMYSMPSNQIELWAALESDRMAHPVMREFYKERSVVMEERRMRTDSSPTGRLVEQFLGTAFMANPYHRPTIGYASDLESFSATDADRVFPALLRAQQHGDRAGWRSRVRTRSFPLSSGTLDSFRPRPNRSSCITIEPPQNSVREVTLHDPAQPFYLEGYHRPSYLAPDDAVYDAISDILSNGRTSRLYRSLVRDKQIAAVAAGFSGFPGIKYSHLFAFYAVPIPGHTTAELQKAFVEEIGEAEEAGRNRRRVADVQDAHQSGPDSWPGQQ